MFKCLLYGHKWGNWIVWLKILSYRECKVCGKKHIVFDDGKEGVI